MTSLQGKVVFITGGARGIGAEVARRLRDRGAKLVLTDLDSAELTRLAAELGEDHVLAAVADVRDLPAMESAAARAVERFGGIDVVVANVSALAIGPGEDNWRASFEVDLMHTVRLVEAALPHLEASSAPAIVAVSSVSGR
ncbi:MAG: hypothetical protein QOC58_1156, partial [Mycobacterium sp.]|nr:hypothetical protein [Mycobacterium sp.]